MFRQVAGSQIVVTAHRIRRGLMPEVVEEKESDFHFIARDEPERIVATLEDMVSEPYSTPIPAGPDPGRADTLPDESGITRGAGTEPAVAARLESTETR